MQKQIPLAELLRPESLDGYLGQKHLLGENAILRRSIENGNIPSMILWGRLVLEKLPLPISFPER